MSCPGESAEEVGDLPDVNLETKRYDGDEAGEGGEEEAVEIDAAVEADDDKNVD